MMELDTTDWGAVQAQYEALQEVPLSAATVQAWLERWSDLEARLMEDAGNAASRTHEDSTDEAAEARHLHYLREILPKAQVAQDRLVRRLLAVDDYEPPADQRTMMRDFETKKRLFCETNVPLQTEVGLRVSEYRKVTGRMTVRWEGETLTLDQAELHLHDRERATREAVWRSIHTRWLLDRERLNDLFLELLSLRRRIARNAGFDEPRAYFWLERGRYDYSPDDARRFHDAIEETVVPVVRRLYEAQQEALGVGTLRPWDLDLEPGEQPPLRPFTDVAVLEAGCARIFAAIDPVLGEQFEGLRNGYLDLAARPNKAPGGYCRSLPVARQSYIFMNAVGRHRNVQTLLHEGGHAFHNQHAHALPLLWQRRAPAEMAEVASMAMELLAHPYLEESRGGFYDESDARRARARHLEKIVHFFPYMAVVDAFQHWLYAEAPDDVTPAALDDRWGELWDRFMVGIDYSGLQAEKLTGWHRKRHIFLYPFYYIEYGLAQVGALQVWRNAMTDPEGALRAYREALALGGTRPLPELYAAAGARLAFDAGTLRELMALVEERLVALRA